MAEISDDTFHNVVSMIIDGLTTDGAHHKQWALEEALRLLVPDDFDTCKSSSDWEDGVAP